MSRARSRAVEAAALEIESIDLEGRGVAHRDGKVVFLDGAAPGERVRWIAERSRARFETGRVVAIERASSQRVRPACPHFGLEPGCCGGCSMQHIAPRAQLAIKQRALEDTLWHVGRVRPATLLRPVAGPAWHYRHRARLSVRHVARKGGVLVGFHERASSYVADMRECHVLPRHVSALLVPLRDLVGALSIRERLPQVELALGVRGAATAVVLVFRVLDAPSAADRALFEQFARRHGVSVWLQTGGPATAAPIDPAEPPVVLALPEFGVEIPFGPTDFTQVNHAMNEVLVRIAVRLLDPGPGERVLDLFCGLGNFSLPMATRAARVIGIEGSAALVQRAAAAAERNGLAARTRFRAADLYAWGEREWEDLLDAEGPIERVLVDPPREGALAVAKVLASTGRTPRRVVYVSCNPATLARDCAVLVHEGGWSLRAAGVLDMFPQTSHVESVAVLEPRSDGSVAMLESAV